MKAKMKLIMIVLALGLIWTTGVFAQGGTLVPLAGFDMTGFIQEATRANVGSGSIPPILRGGTLTINGIKMIVPNNTIVQFPASSWTWDQLFRPENSASIGYTPARPNHAGGRMGLALADSRLTNFPSFEVRVNGNISPDPVSGAPRYIVGLIVPVSQQGFNASSGIINFIDYDGTVLGIPGRFRVGGVIGDATTGSLLEINDPVGRFGAAHSPDPRFTCDTNNPTISAVTGFPVGIPRVAPPAIDPLCPLTNRPLNGDPSFPVDPFIAIGAPLRTFSMPAPGAGIVPDATQQVPLMVGDWVDYSGTLMKIDPAGPNTAANMFISVHTLTANLGIYTAPGTQPAYMNASVLIGTNGSPVTAGDPPTVIPEERSTRITTEGFCTDSTNIVDFYAIDVDPASGAETLRLLGSALPEAGPARPRGRWRFIVGKGAFTPVTREYIAKTRTGQTDNVANGLTAGQYRLPCFDYIFTEGTVMGQPILPFNFQDIPFLAQGNGPLNGTGPVVGRLDPWPGN